MRAGGELVSFRILCAGSEAGECGVEPLDLDARVARVWADPADADVLALVSTFACEELGLSLQP